MNPEIQELLAEMSADDYCKFKFGKRIEKALKAAPVPPSDLEPAIALLREGMAKLEEATGKKTPPKSRGPKAAVDQQPAQPK